MNKAAFHQKKNEAKALIVDNGYSQRLAAKLTGISEMTISRWAQKHNWQKVAAQYAEDKNKFKAFLGMIPIPGNLDGNVKEQKKFFAAFMVIVRGKSQKEAAKLLDITENTVSRWSKELQWKHKKKMAKKIGDSTPGFNAGFYKYLKDLHPKDYLVLQKVWEEYMAGLFTLLNSWINDTEKEQAAFGNESVFRETASVSTEASFKANTDEK